MIGVITGCDRYDNSVYECMSVGDVYVRVYECMRMWGTCIYIYVCVCVSAYA